MLTFKQFVAEAKFKVCGMCFPWAWKNYILMRADNKKVVLKHGMLLDTWGTTNAGKGSRMLMVGLKLITR